MLRLYEACDPETLIYCSSQILKACESLVELEYLKVEHTFRIRRVTGMEGSDEYLIRSQDT